MEKPIATVGIGIMPDRENYTDRCLESLFRQSFKAQSEILLVQHPGYHYKVPFSCPDNITIKEVESGKNLSSKRNDILKYAKGKYILFIDDDAFADANWLSIMITSAEIDNLDIFWGSIKPIYEKKLPESLYPYEMSLGGFHYDRNGKLRRIGLIGCNFGIRNGLEHKRGAFVETIGRGSEIRGGEEILFYKEYHGNNSKFIENAVVYHHIQEDRINFKYILFNQFNNTLTQVYINKIVKESNTNLGLSILINFIKALLPQKNYIGNLMLSLYQLLGFCKGSIKYSLFSKTTRL